MYGTPAAPAALLSFTGTKKNPFAGGHKLPGGMHQRGEELEE
jgi:hypothetical protein